MKWTTRTEKDTNQQTDRQTYRHARQTDEQKHEDKQKINKVTQSDSRQNKRKIDRWMMNKRERATTHSHKTATASPNKTPVEQCLRIYCHDRRADTTKINNQGSSEEQQ